MSQPNILLITSDQQHWYTLGKYNPEIKTPHLDRLAERGMLCNRAYCPNPTCTPTRASILTGLQPSQHGAWTLGTKLPESIPTIGDFLEKQRYDRSLIGKAHFQPLKSTPENPSIESYPLIRDIDYWQNFHGPFYGFNHVELARHHGDETHVGQHYAIWCEEQGFTSWRDHFQNQWGPVDFSEGKPNPPQEHSWSLPEKYHSNVWIADRSIERIQRNADKNQPFFLWASFFDPHPPYVVPEPWASMYDPTKITLPQGRPDEHTDNPPLLRKTQEASPDYSEYDDKGFGNHGCHSHLSDAEQRAKDIAIYYGMVSFMDQQIGRILDELDRLGIADETLIVFTSDHGHYYGQHNLTAKGPFHYEDGVRVPFIASWPNKIPSGSVSDSLISLTDLAPTFLNAAALEEPSRTQGHNQLPVWLGQSTSPRDHVVIEHRTNPQRLYLKTLVTERYKLTVHLDEKCGELYDLANDPDENQNLWSVPSQLPLRESLLRKLIYSEMKAEPISMERLSIA